MAATLRELSDLLAGQGMAPAIEGDPARLIRGVATLEEAADGEISFFSNPKYARQLQTTRASAVVLKPGVPVPEHLACIRAADPYAAITMLIVALHGHRQHRPQPPDAAHAFIHPSAKIGPGATIHPGATIAEDVVIGASAVIYGGCYVGPRCHIGDNLLLYPNVVIYDDTRIGDRVTIHAGTVVGNDGLGYAPVDGKWVKIPQIGSVELGDDVELGSNCSIDRATLGKTVIGPGTKFSNLIAVGHGTRIGANCLLVAQVGLAGSVEVGNHVTMAGQVGIVGHIRIGDNATIGAKAGVINNVADGETVLGQPALPINETKRRVAYVGRLPEMHRTLKALERRIAELEAQLAARHPDRS